MVINFNHHKLVHRNKGNKINAGGIINVYAELEGYDKKEIMRKTENIYKTTLEILENAETHGITTNQAAVNIAQSRIDSRKIENNR